jgi:DNA repair protein RadC
MKRRARYSFGQFRIETLRETPHEGHLESPAQIHTYWHQHIAPSPQMQLPDKEHLVVVLLNTHLRPLGWHLVSMGSLNSCDSHPREILRPVLIGAAHGFLLMHNHPSGDPTPSDPDRRLTRRMKDCAENLHLHFIDHVIIGHDLPHQSRPFFSFREYGLV